MSSEIRLSGEIRIDPPLKWSEIQKFPKRVKIGMRAGHREVDANLRLQVDEESRDTEEAEMIVRTAKAIVPDWSGERRSSGYTQEFLQVVADTYPDRTFTGYIEETGDYGGEIVMNRFAIVDGTAEIYKPTIVWPKEVQDRPDLPF